MDEAKAATKCLFCAIVAGRELSFNVWEDEGHVAFLSLFPNTVGFTVVVTKSHEPSDILALPSKVRNDLFDAAAKVNKLLLTAFGDVGRVAVIAEGLGVDHAHLKLVPLHGTMKDGNIVAIASQNKTFYPAYPGYVSSNASLREDDDNLARVAKRIQN